jgi:hypothetical protein
MTTEVFDMPVAAHSHHWSTFTDVPGVHRLVAAR